MYKLNYKEHMILKQAAYLIMQNHNNKEYNSDKPNKQFIKYQQTLTILYRKQYDRKRKQVTTTYRRHRRY